MDYYWERAGAMVLNVGVDRKRGNVARGEQLTKLLGLQQLKCSILVG
jgi:hypothetical protein